MTVRVIPLDRRTLPQVLQHQAEQLGSRPFLIDELGPLGWIETWEAAGALGAGLSRAGIRRGDLVVLGLDNRREFVLSWFGLAIIGAVEVPINPDLRGSALAHVVGHSGARAVVVGPTMVPAVVEVAARLDSPPLLIVVGDEEPAKLPWVPYEELAGCEAACPEADLSGGDIAAVIYTSGTTGPAKGVVMPHAQHYENGRQAAAAASITAEDGIFLCLPLHHNMAQGYGVWPALLTGAWVRLLPHFDRRRFWDQVRECGATVLPFVGGILSLLLENAPEKGDGESTLRVAYGVPVPADVHAAFEGRFGIRVIHGYGSTEATIPVWGSGSDRRMGAAGRPIDAFEVRVFDELDRPLPAGSTGEICIRATEPFVMFQGYHREPDRTLAAYRNLWFHTGDLGAFDADGHLWFRGRKLDLIRRFGEFIDPLSVEEAIAAHPDVVAVAAYGVPSAVTEEEVMVSVVLRRGRSLSPDAVRAMVAEYLPPFAVPRFVEILDRLPVTATGKVERYKLRDRGITDRTDDARLMRRPR